MNLLYVNPGDSSVMEAQVLTLLEYYNQENVFSDIILLQGYKNKSNKAIISKKLKGFACKTVWFRIWSRYTILHYLAKYTVNRKLTSLKLNDSWIIHVRGEYYGAIIYKYLKAENPSVRQLTDVRGASVEEINEFYNHPEWLKRDKQRLIINSFKILKKNAKISVVSEALKFYLISKYGIQEDNIVIHPNIAGKQFVYSSGVRKTIRRELNIPDNVPLVISLSGGGASWQDDQELVLKLAEYGLKVINLSPNFVYHKNIVNRIIPFEQVPAYLAAADYAILWRKKSVVNEVASPCKFSEFACMGVHVVHNGTVKMVTDYLSCKNFGTVIASIKELCEIPFSIIGEDIRMKNAIIGQKEFSVFFLGKSYLNHYKEI